MSSLKQKMIAVIDAYIVKASSIFSFLSGIGGEGKKRAEAYKILIQGLSDNDGVVFNYVLHDVKRNLGTSKILRASLAKELAKHQGFSEELIERNTQDIFARSISFNGVILKSMEQATVEAALGLIKTNPLGDFMLADLDSTSRGPRQRTSQ